MSLGPVLIVDYGMGNLQSIKAALGFLDCSFMVSAQASDIANARRIILPGVGSYYRAMENIRQRRLLGPLKEAVVRGGCPILGICLGMQLLASLGREGGEIEGLGFVNAVVEKFDQEKICLPVPHVGFNEVRTSSQKGKMFEGIADSSDFYFVHSYRISSSGAGWEAGTTEYGDTFVAAIEDGNIWGCQFHPEKSQKNGLRVLRNFLRCDR